MKAALWIWENVEPLAIVFSIVCSAAGWLIHSRFPTRAAVSSAVAAARKAATDGDAALAAKLADHHERLIQMEGALASVATKDDIGRVLQALERQDGDRRTLAERIDGMKSALARIEKPLDLMNEFLLKGGR